MVESYLDDLKPFAKNISESRLTVVCRAAKESRACNYCKLFTRTTNSNKMHT